jgi:hypothetical protein
MCPNYLTFWPITNPTQPRTLNGIYMRPVMSAQGRHEILHLATNAVIQSRNVTVLPITPAIISVVKQLTKQDGMMPFTMDTKHGIPLYHAALTAGVDHNNDECDDDEDNEDGDD